MKRDVAEKIMRSVTAIDLALGEIGGFTDEIEDQASSKQIRRAVACLILDMYENITREIVKDFPDLHPDKP